MDQQKIGEFIAKLRKEKGLTQQELAKKIGVTDKAISKWETGRCLMDIAMLKPLSEQLDISILELMNGERIAKEEINNKTTKFIDNTINLANKKIKKRIKIIIRAITVILLFIGFTIGYLFYKIIANEYLFNYEAKSCYNVIEKNIIHSSLSFEKEIIVTTRSLNKEEYLLIDNLTLNGQKYSLKIKNKNLFNNCPNNCHQFHKLTSDGKYYEEIINFSLSEPLLEQFKYESSNEFGDTFKYREKLLQKNNITTDLELLKYIRNNYHLNDDNNIFLNSFQEIRDNYIIVDFINMLIPTNLKESSIITGDYNGYILTTTYTSSNFEKNEVPSKLVYITKNNINYIINFIGEHFTDEYIQDLLSTLVIE